MFSAVFHVSINSAPIYGQLQSSLSVFLYCEGFGLVSLILSNNLWKQFSIKFLGCLFFKKKNKSKMLILREIKLNLKMLQNIYETKYEPWQIKYKILKWLLTR